MAHERLTKTGDGPSLLNVSGSGGGREGISVIGRMHHVIIDCPDPAALAIFYSELLGQPVTYSSEDFVVVAASDRASGLGFQFAPDYKPPT